MRNETVREKPDVLPSQVMIAPSRSGAVVIGADCGRNLQTGGSGLSPVLGKVKGNHTLLDLQLYQ
jgi:hypothetical protein